VNTPFGLPADIVASLERFRTGAVRLAEGGPACTGEPEAMLAQLIVAEVYIHDPEGARRLARLSAGDLEAGQ
jgi:hypothetical protein